MTQADNCIHTSLCLFVSFFGVGSQLCAAFDGAALLLRFLHKLIFFSFQGLHGLSCRGPIFLVKALMPKVDLILLRLTTQGNSAVICSIFA